MPLNNPYASDNVAKNAASYPRGNYLWLKVELRSSRNGPLIAPANDFASHPSLITITDPASSDITGVWLTNAIDPDDPSDVYDANHPDYTGVTGIFHDGGGNIAAKVYIPPSATLQANDSQTPYKVSWEIKHTNGTFVTDNEVFGVDETGVLVFGGLVSPSEITASVSTSLDNTQIEELIARSERWASGMLDACGIDSNAFTELPPLIKEAIISKTQGYIIDFDASAGGLVTMRKEGSKQIRYSASSEKLSKMFHAEAKELMDAYCTRHGPAKRIRFNTFRQRPNDGQFKRPGSRDLFE